jgi:hypothetical protein
VGASSLLQGGSPSSHPQLHLIGHHLCDGLRGVLGDGTPLEPVAPPFQGRAFCQEGG